MEKTKKATTLYFGHDFLQGGDYNFFMLKTKADVVEILRELNQWKQMHDTKYEKGSETETEYIAAVERYSDLKRKLFNQLGVACAGSKNSGSKRNYEMIHDEVGHLFTKNPL
jgi:hypothetical protein